MKKKSKKEKNFDLVYETMQEILKQGNKDLDLILDKKTLQDLQTFFRYAKQPLKESCFKIYKEMFETEFEDEKKEIIVLTYILTLGFLSIAMSIPVSSLDKNFDFDSLSETVKSKLIQ